MKQFIKHALWRVSGRDHLVLNPDWTVLFRNGEYAQLGSRSLLGADYLPLRYNYHTAEPWRFEYALQSAGPGTLRYSLGLPNEAPLCDITLDLVLPDTLKVARCGQTVVANGRPMAFRPGAELPADAVALWAAFEFKSAAGATLVRRAAHRIQRRPGRDYDESYFRGRMYVSYEEQAAPMMPHILDRAARHAPLEGRLLDIGCATGLMVACATSRGLDAEGVDISPWAVERANERTDGRCRTLDIETASRRDFPRSYDFVMAHAVLEHVGDPERLLRLMFEICRPGGVVYVHTLNADSLMHKAMDDDWCGFSDFTHRSPWITADWLSTTARSIGFEIAELSRDSIWNDNTADDVWRSFSAFLQMYPARMVLHDFFGDTVDAVLRRPAD